MKHKQVYMTVPTKVPLNKELIDEYDKMIPRGYENAISSMELIPQLEKLPYWKEFEKKHKVKVVIDRELIQALSFAALIHFNVPVAGCQDGRYIIKTLKDKAHALSYLESIGYDKNKKGDRESIRYKKIKSIQIKKTKPKDANALKAKLRNFRPKHQITYDITDDDDINGNGQKMKIEVPLLTTKQASQYFFDCGFRISVSQLSSWRSNYPPSKFKTQLKFRKILDSNAVRYTNIDIIQFINDNRKVLQKNYSINPN